MYELGIFGSLTPTSDIDIGIQYAYNESTAEKNYLSYFVKHFENLFIIYTGVRSLDFDIETYATLNVMNINKTPTFFLSSEKFTQTHFNKLLPIVMNSMVRNNLSWFQKYMSQASEGSDETSPGNTNETFLNVILRDVNTKLSQIQWIKPDKDNPTKEFDVYNYTDFATANTDIITIINTCLTQYTPSQNGGKMFGGDPSELAVCIRNSIKTITNYNLDGTELTDYNNQRDLYYKAVDKAEQYISTNFKGNIRGDVEPMCDAMRLIGVANTYRHES